MLYKIVHCAISEGCGETVFHFGCVIHEGLMKRLFLSAAAFGCLFVVGCNESNTSLDDHFCQAFYDTVTQSGKQLSVDLATSPKLDQAHKTYALTNANNGSFTVEATQSGTLVLATSNLESDLKLTINGTVVEGVMSSECDMKRFTWIVNNGDTVTVNLATSASSVLLVFSYED